MTAVSGLLDLPDLLELLPDLIADAQRLVGPAPGLRKVTCDVVTVNATSADVHLDEDEPGVITTLQLAAAVGPGDRAVAFLSDNGGGVIVGTGAPTGSPNIGPGTPTFYSMPTVTVAASGAGAYEIGDPSVVSVDLTATTVSGTISALAELRFYRDGVLIQSVTTPSLVETFTDLTPVTTTTVYTVELSDGVTTVVSNEARFDFVYPYYYGLSATDALGTAVAGLTKDVAVESTRSYAFTLTATPQYLYFALPSAYDPIVVIRDNEAGVEYFPVGWKTVATVTTGGTSYDVYQSADLQVDAAGTIYSLDFQASVDATRGGSELIDASQLSAIPDGELSLNGANVQTQLYELADRTGPLARLYLMGSVFEEWDYFGGGRSDNLTAAAASTQYDTDGLWASGAVGTLGWLSTLLAGGSLSNPQSIDSNSMGYYDLTVTDTGSPADVAGIYRNVHHMSGSPAFTLAWRFKLPNVLNDGTNDIKVRIGLHDSVGASGAVLPTDGFWWEYGHTDSTYWYLRSSKAAVYDNQQCTVLPSSDYQWFVMQCDGSPDAPTVRGWILDDIADWVPGTTTPTAILSLASTIPDSTNAYGPAASVNKKAGSVARAVRISRYYLRVGHN